MRPILQHVASTSPITSLAFINSPNVPPNLLVGEGSFVKILSTSSQLTSFPKPKRVFARERIHGIALSPDEHQVLFWGGRSICITLASSLSSQGSILGEVKAPDWVFYAVFLPFTDGIPNVAVVTAHNSLLLYTPKSGWTELASGDRCMLYSAHLLHLPADAGGEEEERILVAAGTVFGEILIWSAALNEATNGSGKIELHNRLLGHEGSIFGVSISPLYEGKRYLASCSDDRTVRIWDISHLPTSSTTPEEAKDGRMKNTGFRHSPKTASTSVRESVECISLGWGHTARIWGVRFLPEITTNSEIRIVSISEDLTSRFWAFSPSTMPSLIPPGKASTIELKNTATYLLHSGKHIWSYALNFDFGLLATGGADGRVGLVEYNDSEHGEEEWDMETMLKSLPDEDKGWTWYESSQDDVKKLAAEDNFRSYAVLDAQRFLVTTSLGRIFTYNLYTKTWKHISNLDDIKGWSVLASWEHERMIGLGDGKGQVGIMRFEKGSGWYWDADGADGVEKIAGVWTSVGIRKDTPIDNKYIQKRFYILTTTLSSPVFNLHTIFQDEVRENTPLAAPATDGAKKFVVTSFCIDYATSLVILGSRNGAVAVYALATGALHGCWQGIHEADAVTSITSLSPSRVLTLGRNGGYCVLAFSLKEGVMEMTVHHATKPANCNVIEGASCGRGRDELILYGFRGKSFFVWDEIRGYEVATVECGGAHRAWAFYWPGRQEKVLGEEEVEKEENSGEGGWLVWTKASKVHIARVPLSKQRILQAGLHGRELKAIALSPDQKILATGAEDTVIRLSTLDAAIGKVCGVGVFKRHTTGVHHLCWSSCGRWLFSSGGVEEFFVWRVRNEGEGKLGVVEEAKCPVGGGGGDLRIVGFAVVSVETDGEVVGFVVGMGCSDGSVKIHYYHLATKAFTLLITGRDKTCCLLHAEWAILPPASTSEEGRILLLTAATDGFVAAYELTDALSSLHIGISAGGGHLTLLPEERAQTSATHLPPPILKQRIHQSGIKSLTITSSPRHIIIFTGGDDCAFGITRIVLRPKVKAESYVLPRAHASAVTAVVLVGDMVVTAGVDQVVKVWNVDTEGEDITVKMVGEGYTSVADVARAVGVQDESGKGGWVVVGGVGVDIWRVEGEE